jgi:hypothetical protein
LAAKNAPLEDTTENAPEKHGEHGDGKAGGRQADDVGCATEGEERIDGGKPCTATVLKLEKISNCQHPAI